MSEPAKCYQCSKPAMYTDGEQNIPLCLDCYFKLFQIRQIQIENNERMVNFWSDAMDYQTGLPPAGPHFPPRKSVHLGGVTLHNIKITNSTVGSINSGTIGTLDVAISSIRQNDPKVADALTQLSQAVVNTQSVAQGARNEMLEILSVLASEAASPKERQRTSVTRTLLTRLRELVGLASALTTLWQKWEPILIATFGK